MLALSAARGVLVFDLAQLDSGARVDADKNTETKNER
jgi:hypothetical protein